MIRPDDLFDLAESLGALAVVGERKGPERETLLRCSIGRYYYAVFHAAQETAARCGYLPTPAGGSHESLWASLGERGFDEVRAVARALKFVRVQADYETAPSPFETSSPRSRRSSGGVSKTERPPTVTFRR